MTSPPSPLSDTERGNDRRLGVRAAIVREGRLLLVGFYDPAYDPSPDVPHYNLPGGGVEPGESLPEAIRREVLEETGAEVEVGQLLLVSEYVPAHGQTAGARPILEFLFECRLRPGEEPHLPTPADPMETEVRWVPLEEVSRTRLLCIYGERLLPVLKYRGDRDAAGVYYEFSGEPDLAKRWNPAGRE